jgi:hypothetical protein
MSQLIPGTIVKNLYGKTLTIAEILGASIRTTEEPTVRYSTDKLFIKGVSVRDYLKKDSAQLLEADVK